MSSQHWTVTDGPKYVKLTRKLAAEFVEMEPCPDDRALQPHRLSLLSKALEENRFRSPDWASAQCDETGITYRVNGKHTSTLLYAAEKLPDIKVSVTQYRCETLKDVAALYATFDARFSARSSGDIYAMYAHSVEELKEVDRRVIKLACAGIAYAIWEAESVGGSARMSVDTRAEEMIRHPQFILWLQSQELHLKENRFLKRGPVVAAMFKTRNKNKKASDEFWEEVRTGSNPKNDSPSRVLQRYLMTTSVSRGGNPLQKPTSNHEMMSKAITGYNAWRRGEPTALKYYATSPTPEVAA